MKTSYDEQLEQRIAEFEQQWKSSPPADLRAQLLTLRSDDAGLLELLAVDLEYRWRSKRGSLNDELGGQPRIEDYVRFAKSCECELVVSPEWIAEEFRVRQIWGDQPSQEHFLGRFPGLDEDVGKLLLQVKVELARESIRHPTTVLEFDKRAPLRHQDFTILEMIGAGVSGKVYRAKQLSLGRMVAMKTLHKSLHLDDWAVDAFLREGQILAALDHPGIARVFGMGRFPGGGYFQIQELVEGTNVREWLSSCPAIDNCELIRVVKSIANAIAMAHQHSIVHCDIKPENILMSSGRIVVADFGMATRVSSGDSSGKEVLGGTPEYMAPELGDGATTAAADVYAIGVLWAELRKSCSDLEPDEWVALRERCVSEDPAERPTASELLEQLA